jgi:hypothetical protein
MRNSEKGKVGWILLWLLGIPIPILETVLFHHSFTGQVRFMQPAGSWSLACHIQGFERGESRDQQKHYHDQPLLPAKCFHGADDL